MKLPRGPNLGHKAQGRVGTHCNFEPNRLKKARLKMTCHNCRINAPKHGKHRNGLQRYRCNQCGKTLTEPHEERFQMEDHLKTERGLLAIRLLVEGSSVRTAARITGLHHRTVVQLAVIAGQRCEAL